MDEKRFRFGGATGISGLAAGAVAGLIGILLTGTAIAQQPVENAPEPLLEATHLPALLTVPFEPVELRYDVYCTSSSPSAAACDASGTVFVRAGNSGAYREVPLREDPGRAVGRFVAQVPADVAHAASGFSYYAVVRSETSGRSVTLPSGGASSPQRSRPLTGSTEIALGSHVFGQSRAADARVAQAAWGEASGQVGLEQGRNLTPIGGSAFDVDATGAVSVLDEANRRLLRWRSGAVLPEHVPLVVNGTMADLSVADDGTVYVLETTSDPGRGQLLRVFTEAGDALEAIEIAERAATVRSGATGPVVLQQPSGQWMSTAVDGEPLALSDQTRSGKAGRPVTGGREVVVLRHENEIRAALVGKKGHRSWRLTSTTSLAEVQLAEPFGDGLLLVVRTYTDVDAEFLVLVLADDGIATSFSLATADWAETAPLSRFRLEGSSLYQLGSTPAGLFVDRFDLEVS